MNGWLKFHRQSAENKIWKHDLVAWHVFETLLIYCTDGVWEGGRFQLAELAGLNPNTTYSALKRLKSVKMATLSSNTKYSIISICNWNKYQSRSTLSDNNGATTAQQPDTTLIKNKELKNKEYKYTRLKITAEEYEHLKEEFQLKDVKSECDKANDWLANSNKHYKDFFAFMRNWLRRTPDNKAPTSFRPFIPPEIKPVSQDGLSKLADIRNKINIKSI